MSSDIAALPACTDLDLAIKSAIEAIDPEMSNAPDLILEMHGKVSELSRILREAKALTEAKFIAVIGVHGDIECGEDRYYVGQEKRTKPSVSNSAVLEGLLDALAGDADQIALCMAAGAWKPGQIKALIGEEKTAELFVTETVADLKTGKPKRGLKVSNPNFAR